MAGPKRISSRSLQKLPQEDFHFRAPDFPLPLNHATGSRNRSLQAQDQVAWRNCRSKLAESFPSLPLDGIAHYGGPGQAFRYDQSDPRSVRSICRTKMKVETRASHHPPRCHDGGKLFRPVQALLRVKRSAPLRRRDDDGPWHDARVSRHGHPGCACALGSRGCVYGAQPRAGRCVSWQYPLNEQSRELQRLTTVLSSATISTAVDNFSRNS